MSDKTLKVGDKRLNGLKLRAITNKPKTNVKEYADHIFENADVPKISEQELNKKLREIEA